MKARETSLSAERAIRRISDLRELGMRLLKIGYESGLHDRNPGTPRPLVGGHREAPKGSRR